MTTKSKAVGIYNVYGIQDESKIIINQKEVVYPKENETINDIFIKEFPIMENIKGKIYACNITDSLLMTSKTLPLMYITVVYEKRLFTVGLYKMYLSFDITDNIQSEKELLNSPINGKFKFDLILNNKIQTIDNNIPVFIGNDATYEKFINFTTADAMKDMINVMIIEIDESMREKYNDDTNSFKMPSDYISLKNYDFDNDDNDDNNESLKKYDLRANHDDDDDCVVNV